MRPSLAAIALAIALGGCAAHDAGGHGSGRARYGAMVDAAALAAGVPPGIAQAVIRYESNYDPARRGAAGEWGLGQIKCASARAVGFAGDCHALADAQTNLRYAMAYLRRALDTGGDACAGVSLYNTGLGARPRCTAYGRAVMARARLE